MRIDSRRLSYTVAFVLALSEGSLSADPDLRITSSHNDVTLEGFGDAIPTDDNPVRLGETIAAINDNQWQSTVTE